MNHNPELRLIHVTVYRDLPGGVRKQIKWEQQASSEIKGAQWEQLALHSGEVQEPFEKRIPRIFRPLLLRNLYAWIVVLQLARRYDYVLLRHMPFDPFVFFFAPFVPNRIGVHHSKEAEELRLIRSGLQGRLASWLEYLSGWVAVRTARAILAMTPEIAEYQTAKRSPGKAHAVYSNGINLKSVELLADKRKAGTIEAAFICHTFSGWHGLDRLIEAVADAESVPENLTIHLIGQLSDEQEQQIEALKERAAHFHIHGYLESDAYRRLLSGCDMGIGSLAMDRQSLRQGTTLKVRELLALGLPVYSGHEDSALPKDFPYYHNSKAELTGLCHFAQAMKRHSRQEIRNAAAPYIEKRASMQKVVNWLQTL